jgi:YceI-like domain
MLHQLSLLRRDGIEIADVSCRHPRGRGEALEHRAVYAIVFVRRGCFVRSADGFETTYDSTRAYCMVPGQEQRYDHPHHDGDDCTAIFLADELVESLSGGERALPVSPLQTTPRADLEHRLLLAEAMKQMDDEHSLVERALQQTIDDEVLKATAIDFSSERVDGAPDSGRLTVRGALAFAGATNPVTFDLNITEDGHLTGSAVVKQSDWGIKPYSALFGALKVADEVTVTVDADLGA